MVGANLITTVIPPIVATASVVKTTQAVFPLGDRKGNSAGTTHYHYKGRKPVSHRHPGGHISHMHRGLPGYGRRQKTLRR